MSVPPTGTVTFLFTDIEGSTRLWERDSSAMQAALARHDEILRGTVEDHAGFVFKTVEDAFCSGHGGQVLLSLPTQELVRDQLPSGAGLRDLGERRLKDLFRPERVFQLVAPGLPEEFPSLRTLDTYRNNLPAQPTPLVGREREVSAICERLRSPEVRLLTLMGPGGTGKTRVGLQAAAELIEEYEGGVFFVPLATVADPALVASTAAQALGVTETDRWRRGSRNICATGRCSSCWTTSSRCWRRRRSWKGCWSRLHP
jgi:hypothetical protein